MALDDTASPMGDDQTIRGDATAREERVAAAREALGSVALPVANLNAALPQLRRPFAPEAVKFKVQTAFGEQNKPPSGCVIVSYIDARLVVERLNAVCGGEWSAVYRPTSKEDLMLCDLTVFGVTRTDLGESGKGLSKDLISDSLKRSAVMFGVGVSVYALARVTFYLNDAQGRIKPKKIKGKDSIALTDQGHEWLRGGYRRWLAGPGEAAFGQALDHGDVVPETIDPEAEAAMDGEDFTPAAPPALEDERAVALQDEARALYAEIAAVQGAQRAFPAATFDAWLRQSAHSHEALEQLVGHVRDRRDQLVGGAA